MSSKVDAAMRAIAVQLQLVVGNEWPTQYELFCHLKRDGQLSETDLAEALLHHIRNGRAEITAITIEQKSLRQPSRWYEHLHGCPPPKPRVDTFRKKVICALPSLKEWSNAALGRESEKPREPVSTPNEMLQSEQETSRTKRTGSRKPEAEIRVREWLGKNAVQDPNAVTRDQIAKETGVSCGMVSETAAWRAFRDERDSKKMTSPREVPLSDRMQAIIPADCQRPDEIAALNEADEKDKAQQERRHNKRQMSRHEPS